MRYLFLLLIINTAYADTTCTTNSLGDRTCVTTTGNILSNSTFGSGNTTTSTDWSTTGLDGIHTHGNFGSFPYGADMDQTGGVLAFEGHVEDNVFQDSALVNDGHLTQSQINEGFTSTLSADVWFWNSIENTLTLKQTITGADGSVTTQSRTINDHDPTRNSNGGTFTNYTDSYIQSPNSQTDITIRAELYNQGDGSNNDNYHRGPDVDNVQLSITTLGETTNCQQLGTCTSVGTEITEAFEQIEEVLTVVSPEELFIYEEFIVEEFIPFEEPELVIEMFSEIYIEEVAVEEINAGVVNVFTLAVPEELIEISPIAMIETFEEMPVIPMEMFEEIPMEVTYGNQETIEEISTEVEVPEERVEVEQTQNNETRVETTESTEEIQNPSRENERETEVASNEVSNTGGGSNEESEPIVRNESSEQTETNEQVAEETTESTETNVGRGDESESREDETTVRETTGNTDTEQPVVQADTETETSVSIDVADIVSQVARTVTSVNDRLVATQQIVARAMSSQSVDSYTSKNNNILIQPLIDGGNIDDYARRNYSDDRQLYASAQDPYQDSMVQRKKKIDEAVSNRIRAEEHLRRIRGY